ncbi:sulfurtransferase complex subunit TusC [Colwellia sp. D2M02]|uniref:sulfurtransferase complex subunit TusC n=1 Tax=Colwellia sp. D2M02 TaxID=2841562 RepID=UPI001C0917E4|nr:sulfurtransferase complex subunit TusC [Colwellia sp. D2M02]MBU2892548.1 sulfurtransferase complex subunit TusC [Colwellia sp. D2M02]
MTTNLLAIINSSAPYNRNLGKESLDVALIFASFEQGVSLFFQGDGVYQLIDQQNPQKISAKDYLKTFSAFEFYDIEDIYICQESLTVRNLSESFHIDNVQVLPPETFAKHLAMHQQILRF